jgi:hypothetical protein
MTSHCSKRRTKREKGRGNKTIYQHDVKWRRTRAMNKNSK